MTERREGGGFVERDLSGDVQKIILDGDKYQKKKRKQNKKMIERGKGIHEDDLTLVNSKINIQGRRTRGKGRRVNFPR